MGRRMTRTAAVALVAAVVAGGVAFPGTAVAVAMPSPADINGDGYGDAVLPAPGATVAGKEYAGAVVVLYGSSRGLSAGRRVLLTQNSAGVPDSSEAWDWFGSSAALADLDRDGYSDLVVGAPGEDYTGAKDAGTAVVLWGGKQGLTAGASLPTRKETQWHAGRDVAATSGPAGAQVLIANGNSATHLAGPFTRTGRAAKATLHDETGWANSVTLGDLNRDSVAERVLISGRMGGQSGGFIYVNSEPFVYPYPRVNGDGRISVVGDVNGDGYGDLIVGDPDEPTGEGPVGHIGGAVHVWFGSPQGVSETDEPMTIHQDTSGVPDPGERHDDFGAAVAVADMDRDGVADIIVGVPGESFGSSRRAGNVVVIPGRRTGQLGLAAYNFSQNTAGVPGTAEPDDFFGASLAVADTNRDGRPDILVGAYGEDSMQGAVWSLPGGTSRPAYSSAVAFGLAAVGLSPVSGSMLGGEDNRV
ncbi:FG-GAP repeat protein [Streptomyces sp. NPDC051219]|uniref:FG-GAP repeat protein n=1 Tax=Streptomyces sp. NPDC051219 TaxID=3155283 RepID=UPI003446CBD5